MRVLLAEDEPDLNRIITKKLTSEGYSVDSCTDGEGAIDCLLCAEYDAVILDIMMPKADGFEVLRRLRGAGKETPVLFLTARDAVSDRVKGLDSGANDYLIKPFSFEELMARLRAITRGLFRYDRKCPYGCRSALRLRFSRCQTRRKRNCAFGQRIRVIGVHDAKPWCCAVAREDRKSYLEL